MHFVRIIQDYDHLWAVKSQDKENDELTDLFKKWNNIEFILDFFTENIEDLKGFSILNASRKPLATRWMMPMCWRN